MERRLQHIDMVVKSAGGVVSEPYPFLEIVSSGRSILLVGVTVPASIVSFFGVKVYGFCCSKSSQRFGWRRRDGATLGQPDCWLMFLVLLGVYIGITWWLLRWWAWQPVLVVLLKGGYAIDLRCAELTVCWWWNVFPHVGSSSGAVEVLARALLVILLVSTIVTPSGAVFHSLEVLSWHSIDLLLISR